MLTEEERILRVFEGKSIDKIPFNIRHEYWYFVNKANGTLPEKYKNLDLAEICKDLGCSWRCYSGYFVESCVNVSYEDDIKISSEEVGERRVKTIIETPIGRLESLIGLDKWKLSSHPIEFPVKSIDDIKILEYILERVKVSFNQEAYERLKLRVRGNGIVSYFFPRSPLQALIYQYIGVPRIYKMLVKDKEKIEELMEYIKVYNEKFYEVMVRTPIKIFNLGENVDVRLTSPKLFKEYCLPYYQEVTSYLHKHHKFVDIHVDGYAKPLLNLLKETGVDGIEAITPELEEGLSLEYIKSCLGDEMIIMDGIPYLYLLPSISKEKLVSYVEKIIKTFPNSLILGISDEVPPPADIERIKLISDILERTEKIS